MLKTCLSTLSYQGKKPSKQIYHLANHYLLTQVQKQSHPVNIPLQFHFQHKRDQRNPGSEIAFPASDIKAIVSQPASVLPVFPQFYVRYACGDFALDSNIEMLKQFTTVWVSSHFSVLL